MAVQNHDPHFFRPPHAKSLPFLRKLSAARRYLIAAFKSRGFFLRKRLASPTQSVNAAPAVWSLDPADAYIQACIAAPFFYYMSPAVYGLTATFDDETDMPTSSQSGDET